jgi:hypothetical protein
VPEEPTRAAVRVAVEETLERLPKSRARRDSWLRLRTRLSLNPLMILTV